MNQKDRLVENTMLALQGKLVEGKKENKEFIKQCEDSGKFNEEQMNEIRQGFKDGLTIEQVKLYANPKYDGGWLGQMREIREGFKNGLTQEQVEVYANPKFKGYQMKEIKEGFKDGLTMEQVEVYANPKFDGNQMFEIQCGFRNGMTLEQINLYADPKFNEEQMRQIREGFKEGLTMEQIKFYADPKFNEEQMYEIQCGFRNGLTMEQIKFYADPKFNGTKMWNIRCWFRDGLTIEQVKDRLNKKAKSSNKNTTDKYKYEIVYYLNTATRDRRPTTRDDFENDWVEETKSFDSDLDAYEYVYTTVYGLEEDDLEDLYIEENVADDDVEGKINAIIGEFEDNNSDPGDGSPLVISIQGHNKNYNSGFDKESFEQEIEDDEDYED